jgi:RNA polymerase sigma factor (TIGR02999 family)
LFPLVYDELRKMAGHRMAAERQDHTLEATALVHEAYLRLVGSADVRWANRAHFFHAAAEAMRRILVEHARAKHRLKRGGGRHRDLKGLESVADLVARSDPDEILAVDEAVRRLEAENPEAASVVRLRFYAGLTPEETAKATDLSPRTVYRHWAYARAWLYRALKPTA